MFDHCLNSVLIRNLRFRLIVQISACKILSNSLLPHCLFINLLPVFVLLSNEWEQLFEYIDLFYSCVILHKPLFHFTTTRILFYRPVSSSNSIKETRSNGFELIWQHSDNINLYCIICTLCARDANSAIIFIGCRTHC